MRLRVKLRWIAAVLLGLLLSRVDAAPLDEYQAATIYTLVYGVTHLPLPATAPIVRQVSHAKLEAKMIEIGVCPKGCPSIKAAQIGNEVWLDEALDMMDVNNAAILFHEFVHYYQWAKDGVAKSCEEWVDRELFAYRAQNEVLHKAGHRLVPVPHMVCG